MIERIAQRCSRRATQLQSQAHSLQQEIKKVMRGFGRQCRGQGHVFVKLVRQTEQQLLELGKPIIALEQQAQQLLRQATVLSDSTRERLAEAFNAAMSSHTHIRQQSTQLTHGKKLRHCKLINAYDLTLAPILKGKSNCPAQFGRKPGIASEPATGFIFANRVPEGNPNDASYVLPLAVGLCLWLQPPGGGKSHRHRTVTRRRPGALQRSCRRRAATGNDSDGS
jgi:hypothetical protein